MTTPDPDLLSPGTLHEAPPGGFCVITVDGWVACRNAYHARDMLRLFSRRYVGIYMVARNNGRDWLRARWTEGKPEGTLVYTVEGIKNGRISIISTERFSADEDIGL